MAISESAAEKMIDAAVHRRLRRDPEYMHAEDAEAASEREVEIEMEETERIYAKYDVL